MQDAIKTGCFVIPAATPLVIPVKTGIQNYYGKV